MAASVSSLDQDMRKLRLDRYTPQAANEVRKWIETTLGERIAGGDLMEALRDGVALCKLVNLATTPGVRYKESSMPFVQMENISHFLRACDLPPLSLPSHDRFLTVDLYDSKDPTQVLQCIAAFSRRANMVNPSRFPTTIGAKSKGAAMSPQGTGSSQGGYAKSPEAPLRDRATSNASNSSSTAFNPLAKASYSGRISPSKASSLSRGGLAAPPSSVSSWSKKGDEGNTAPAWNIHQYGYMGGASQGNQGIAFGARRQITTEGPKVPSLAEKEKRRREEAEAIERQRQEEEEAEQQRRMQAQEEERHARDEEERRWEEESRKLREREKREAEEEKRRWDEEQRQWKEEEEARSREERELESRLASERDRNRANSDARLNGQFLSQYQADQGRHAPSGIGPSAESQKIADLERQLQQAKERERQYESERQAKLRDEQAQRMAPTTRSASPPAPALPSRPQESSSSQQDDWQASERDYLRSEWEKGQRQSPLPTPPVAPRPAPAEPVPEPIPSLPPRPLPEPNNYTHNTNRTDRFLSSNPAPATPQSASHRPNDYSTTSEVDRENERRQASQTKTKAGGWASKSLLEREMERERERQREWEEGQKQTAAATRDKQAGTQPGGTWDVNQYGFTGGDSQNRSGSGLGTSGARRQIIGPRPPP